MPFAYYRRLTPRQKQIYRASDAVPAVKLPPGKPLLPVVVKLARALKQENRVKIKAASQELLDGLTTRLDVARVHVTVYSVRPHAHWGELHGEYVRPSRGERIQKRITVWMRTAQRKQVVAFRTFLRTLLHELCHHLDYELLKLKDSFHTEGFYKRESSLFHQLMKDG